jgi:thymidine phosphorylase
LRVSELRASAARPSLGRRKGEEGGSADPGAGVEILVKIGDEVEAAQPVARLYGKRNVKRAGELVLESLEISDAPVERPPAILGSL